MGLMIKNFNVMGVHWKIQFLGGEVHVKTFFFFLRGGVNRLKRWALIVCRFKRGLGKKEKKEEMMFLRWGLETPNAHYELEEPSY